MIDAVASNFSKRTPNYAPSIHTAHTPSPVHSLYSYHPVLIPRIFTYGTSDTPSPSHESSAEIVTPKGNPTPRNNPTNLVQNIPADPDSYPSFSDSSSLGSSDSYDQNCYK